MYTYVTIYKPDILYNRDTEVESMSLIGCETIYWDLVGTPLCKKLDWGSWRLKIKAKEMTTFLERIGSYGCSFAKKTICACW